MLHKLSNLTKFDLMVAICAVLWYYNFVIPYKRMFYYEKNYIYFSNCFMFHVYGKL